MSVTKYLQHVGINYNTYNYWRKKLKENDSPKPELAPISFTQHADPCRSYVFQCCTFWCYSLIPQRSSCPLW